MFALIWATLLFTATGSGSVQSDNKICECKTFTITLKPTHQTAAAGQCVVFECSFDNKVTSFAWCKIDKHGNLEKFSNVTVECVSRNNIGETKQSLSISEANQPGNSNQQNLFSCLVELLKEKMISVLIVFGVGFLIGSLVTTLIACLGTKCHRNKKKNSNSTDELELVNAEAVFKDWDNKIPQEENNGVLDIMVQDDETLVFQDDGIQNQAAAECGEELHGDLIDSDISPKEVVYSDIDFSALKEKDPADAREKENMTETEYAEIKTGEMEEAQENEGLDCKMLEGNDETEVMIEHQEEAKPIMVEEEVIGEADALYYNKNEVMDEN